MKHKEDSNIHENILLYVIMCSAIAIRILMSIIHFTHIDDVGEINYLLMMKKAGLSNIGTCIEATKWWTYAPAQMLLTSALISEYVPYGLNLMLGRVPSLLAGCFSIVVAHKILNKICPNFGIIALGFICFSWETIIYSAQAEPYEIVVLIGLLLIYDLYITHDNRYWFLIRGVLIAVGCYAHYQFFVLAFAYYLTLLIYDKKNIKKVRSYIASGALTAVLAAPLLYFLISTGKLGRAINWNGGNAGQFIFMKESVLHNPLYILSFFLRNTFLIIKYFFTIKNFETISNIGSVILFIVFLYGLYKVNIDRKQLAVYVDLLLCLNACMIIKGSLSYGPSRHMLYMFPVFFTIIAIGIEELLNIFAKKNECEIFKVGSIVLILALFIFSLPSTVYERQNHYSEKVINEIATEWEPELIIGYADSADLYLMSIDNYVDYSDWAGIQCKKHNSANNGRIMLISRNISYASLNDTNYAEAINNKIIEFDDKLPADIATSYQLEYAVEISNGEEVEYASEYYNNYPNGMHLYVLKSIIE